MNSSPCRRARLAWIYLTCCGFFGLLSVLAPMNSLCKVWWFSLESLQAWDYKYETVLISLLVMFVLPLKAGLPRSLHCEMLEALCTGRWYVTHALNRYPRSGWTCVLCRYQYHHLLVSSLQFSKFSTTTSSVLSQIMSQILSYSLG